MRLSSRRAAPRPRAPAGGVAATAAAAAAAAASSPAMSTDVSPACSAQTRPPAMWSCGLKCRRCAGGRLALLCPRPAAPLAPVPLEQCLRLQEALSWQTTSTQPTTCPCGGSKWRRPPVTGAPSASSIMLASCSDSEKCLLVCGARSRPARGGWLTFLRREAVLTGSSVAPPVVASRFGKRRREGTQGAGSSQSPSRVWPSGCTCRRPP
mmetsp:Transcript_107729/g.347769  ORF Transcript_107729/g.347769 Transcript_107729/m.347769 type:complete len:209 (+) Transcript_107729:511-1137(+)